MIHTQTNSNILEKNSSIKGLFEKIKDKKSSIAIVGLGYVGLPLAIEFGKKYKTIGFDYSKVKISQSR